MGGSVGRTVIAHQQDLCVCFLSVAVWALSVFHVLYISAQLNMPWLGLDRKHLPITFFFWPLFFFYYRYGFFVFATAP